MRKFTLAVLAFAALAALALTACGPKSSSEDLAAPGVLPETRDPYGVYGYVLDPFGGGHEYARVRVTCSCGGAGAQWDSDPTGPDGYWVVYFTQAEAQTHTGHRMSAVDIAAPTANGVEFYYRGGFEGPHNIVW